MKVSILPVVPVKYCRHPDGGLDLLVHSICVTFISQNLLILCVPNVKARAAFAAASVPSSIKTINIIAIFNFNEKY